MKECVLIGALIVLAVSNIPCALAGQRDALQGYQEFKFGQQESEFRKSVEITYSEPDYSGKGVWLDTPLAVEVAAQTFRLRFHFSDQKLDRVSLINNQADDRPSCRARFELALRSLTEKYGEPDLRPSMQDHAAWTEYKAVFTFADDRAITVAGFWFGELGCESIVSYQS